MKQYMPGDSTRVNLGAATGRWPECSLRVPVRPEVKRTIEQGRREPRRLNLEESYRAAMNRVQYREECAELDSWAARELGAL